MTALYSNKENNKLVFVSYAHADEDFMKEALLPFLKGLEMDEYIELWHDRMIGIGDNWYAEIADRLDHAKVAILFITKHFLSSEFCQREEVPVLLQRARRGELKIFPLLATPCLWKTKIWLSPKQMWPRDDNAVSEYDEADQDRVMTQFAEKVLEAVHATGETSVRVNPLDEITPNRDLHRMPQTGSLLFGRSKEIKLLDEAWAGDANIVAFTAGGGVGKSTLARVWTEMLAEDGWRGAERAFAWSFYSQGTGRMTDAESFVNEALLWFGDDDPTAGSLWERGERLAGLIRRRRTLLILDGVEPLQSGEKDVDQGSIRDPGLKTLLGELAKENNGLCVVTTREELSDLKEFGAPSVLHENLDQVSTLAGRALLRVNRVKGSDAELESTVVDLGGHALAVSLLGNLLADGNDAPHISNAKAVPGLRFPVEDGGHPRRVLDAWAARLGASAELELLQLVGLFDRPAARGAVQAVIEGGLSKQLQQNSLDEVLERLREVKLIAEAGTHESTIDTHPVVREHFGERLKEKHSKRWKEGHRSLYVYYKEMADHQPDDLKGMQPLFAAVVHGCNAGLHQEVYQEVYRDRIDRKDEAYLVKKLGAYAADLSCLSHFFAERWSRPKSGLKPGIQSWMLGTAGFDLRALGRLKEAAGPIEEGHRQRVKQENWKNASISAGNLSELYLVLGELEKAEKSARDAIGYADKSGDAYIRMGMRTTHADALHHLGRGSEARALFEEAERIQEERQLGYPLLYSLWGYRYCDLLLAEGEMKEVLKRAEQTIKIAKQYRWLLDIAHDHLSLGRAHMFTSPQDTMAAEQHLQAAVDGLRGAGAAEFLLRGLLASASFHRAREDYDLARRDLDEVRTLVARTGMRLFEADLALESARLYLAGGHTARARDALDKAKVLVEEMNYGRRRPEVEELEKQLA